MNVTKKDNAEISNTVTDSVEKKQSPIPTAEALTQGNAVVYTGRALGGGTSRNVMDKFCTTKPVEPDFQVIRYSILKNYDDVFKEDLSPSDRIKGVQRIEINDSDAKPLHFNTPKEVPVHLRRAADKELKRCLEAGQLEPCHH